MIRSLYVALVSASMFVVRMLILGLMTLLQHFYGGAEIRPASQEGPGTNGKFKAA
jgi:hypothetical protein